MTEMWIQALVNGVLVAFGLFVLWSLVGRMKLHPASFRARAAVLAGLFSMGATLAVTALVTAAT